MSAFKTGCWDHGFQMRVVGNLGIMTSKKELLGYWLLTNGCWNVLAAETGCWDIGSLKRVVEIMASK